MCSLLFGATGYLTAVACSLHAASTFFGEKKKNNRKLSSAVAIIVPKLAATFY